MYVIRDDSGKITALSTERTINSERADPNDPELKAFLYSANVNFTASHQLEESDSGSVRIIEDLVNVLIERGVILFTDLPIQAQQRLLERKMLRKMARKEKGLPDEDESFILSEDGDIF